MSHQPKHLYVFSGLGADERVFQRIDFSGHSVTFIKWIIPGKNETIGEYASRLTSQIKTTRPVLIGLSFGGLMAIEVSKHIDIEKIILIASAKTHNEIPFYFRLTGKLRMHKLVPVIFFKSANFLIYWFFGAEKSEDKKLLKQILKDTNSTFLKWAIDKIALWENKIIPGNIVHLHGSNDRIMPLLFITCDVVIKNGGHLMTLTKSKEVTAELRKLI